MPDDLATRVIAGDRRALARLITLIENGVPGARDQLRGLYPRTGRAQIVGLTGAPGSGKSTLVRALARAYRTRGQTVGVVAVDPTSPFSGGAILGDRVRMTDLSGDPGVFIRSMATRGALGGLARATADVIAVLDAFGKDVVLVETVGVGQDEVDVAKTAYTTLVVSVPGLGDDIQAIKAGILEIADIHVVNKADREGANRLVAELKMLLSLVREADWPIPIAQTVASTDAGVDELVATIDRHWAYLRSTGKLQLKQGELARRQILAIAQETLMARLVVGRSNGDLDALVDAVARRSIDPYSAADRLIAELGATSHE